MFIRKQTIPCNWDELRHKRARLSVLPLWGSMCLLGVGCLLVSTGRAMVLKCSSALRVLVRRRLQQTFRSHWDVRIQTISHPFHIQLWACG